MWPVKIVPEMTYNVLSGTLSLYATATTTNNVIDKKNSAVDYGDDEYN